MAKANQILGLDCDADALDGIGRVLWERFEEMCRFRAAALDWSDIEGVHNMRVASRRLRSTLRDFRPYLRKKVRQRGLRKVAHSLGAVRDEDVAIAALEGLAAEAPEDVRGGIEQFIDERRGRRSRAQRALEKAISETALLRLRDKLAKRFEQATRITAAADAGEGDERKLSSDESAPHPSFRQAGREIILDRMEELKELAGSLYRPSEAEPLHRMRIAAKRLRYAIELFAQCWGIELAWFSEEVARMQESLGELHDCDEWMADFGKRLGRHHDDSKVADAKREEYLAQREAAFWLLERFSKERAKHYRKALERWREWEKADFGSRLSEILDADSRNFESLTTVDAGGEIASADLQSQQEVS